MSEKKITTGQFFRLFGRWALGGGTGENPVTTVIRKGAEHQRREDESRTVIDAEFEPVDEPRKKA